MKIKAIELKKLLMPLTKLLKSNGTYKNSDKLFFNGSYVYVFDGEIYMDALLESDLFGSVDGKLFYKLIDKYKAKEIEIRASENTIQVVCGNSVSDFSFDDNFSTPFDIPEKGWKKLEPNFHKGLELCSYVLSKDESDVNTSVIQVGGNLMQASDGFRMIQYYLEKEVKETFYISKSTLKYFPKVKLKKYLLQDSWLFFEDENGNIIVCRPLGVVKYPDLSELMEQYHPKDKISFPEEIVESLERASLFKEKENELDRSIEVSISKNKATIISIGESGQYKESFSGKFNNQFSFMINSAFFKEILSRKEAEILIDDDVIMVKEPDYTYVTLLEIKD